MTNLQSEKILEYAWKSFREICIHPSAGPTQVNECRKNFYAGAMVVMQSQMAIADQDLSDEAGAAVLQSIWEELLGFAQSLPDNGPGGMTDQELKIIVPPNRH